MLSHIQINIHNTRDYILPVARSVKTINTINIVPRTKFNSSSHLQSIKICHIRFAKSKCIMKELILQIKTQKVVTLC